MPVSVRLLTVASRASPLAQAQVLEVLEEIRRYHSDIEFKVVKVETYGDKDRTTSLRSLGSSDFFTREVDALVLNRTCQIAIHSAKDLPVPLTEGLVLAALTRGVSAADALVLRPGETLKSLPKGAKVATSSFRREECVRELRPDLQFIDIRGTIEERLSKLRDGTADAVVIAEAALIRLGLTHLNRLILPGETARYQGQLAIVTHQDDLEMMELFHPLDTR